MGPESGPILLLFVFQGQIQKSDSTFPAFSWLISVSHDFLTEFKTFIISLGKVRPAITTYIPLLHMNIDRKSIFTPFQPMLLPPCCCHWLQKIYPYAENWKISQDSLMKTQYNFSDAENNFCRFCIICLPNDRAEYHKIGKILRTIFSRQLTREVASKEAYARWQDQTFRAKIYLAGPGSLWAEPVAAPMQWWTLSSGLRGRSLIITRGGSLKIGGSTPTCTRL